ncbi:hypothetical protein PA598K_01455 [Paenibacillus sp. 598K]|uniref:hypothetical protein n=1 Tax=Paenibacillus sp. 598K TaxID=1117987 RepID=UPI000FF930F8|nr:hypothetical protein [Paenibacillus sp. 598K]GBF73170.1 hypothetical protein PA598K_01455 [Paenibacillus sp. 598K]
MTVKDLINELLDYPMDLEVDIEINGDKEYTIDSLGHGYRKVLIKIDVPEESNEAD